MAKGPWEGRVGKLLKSPDFTYSYKPVDSPLHGGAARIDWHACDYMGRYWLIEVKSLGPDRKSFTLDDVSPLQQEGLDEIALGIYSVPVIAVGHRDTLYLWKWRAILLWREDQPKPARGKSLLLPLSTADAKVKWSPSSWGPPKVSIITLLHPVGGIETFKPGEGIGVVPKLVPLNTGRVSSVSNEEPQPTTRKTKTGSLPSSPATVRSRSTLKPKDSTPTPAKTRKLGQSSSKPAKKGSSFVSSRTGGTKSLRIKTRGR